MYKTTYRLGDILNITDTFNFSIFVAIVFEINITSKGIRYRVGNGFEGNDLYEGIFVYVEGEYETEGEPIYKIEGKVGEIPNFK